MAQRETEAKKNDTVINSLRNDIVECKLNEKTMKLDLEKVKVELRKTVNEVKRTTESLIRSMQLEDEFQVVEEAIADGSRRTFKEEDANNLRRTY